MITASSPYKNQGNRIQKLMFTVCLATLPGLAALTWFYGWGYIVNSLLAIATALVTEGTLIAFRGQNVIRRLSDGSAMLTGLLIGLCLPPMIPWWITLVATIFAILFVKQLFGGLGQNPFNPAMAAFALVLISFPLPMTTSWAAPDARIEIAQAGFTEQVKHNLGWSELDGRTMATPLDVYKNQIERKTSDELRQLKELSLGPLYGTLWVNLAFMAGGLILLARKVISWQAPVAFLGSLTVLALLFSQDADLRVPWTMHLFAGGTMLGAFFIVTDPASGATSNRGRLVFGALVGSLVYIIRTWGNFPDAIAFAVLLGNFAAPLIDYYTRPRVYGYNSAVSGYKKDTPQ